MIKLLAKSAARNLLRLAKRLLTPPTHRPDWTSGVEIPGLVATSQGFSGQVGTWHAEIIEREDSRSERSFFRITVQPVLTDLTITPRTNRRSRPAGLRLGNREFDSNVRVVGNVSESLILLEPEVQTLVERLVTELDGSMKGQTLTATVDEKSELAVTLQDLLELAEHLEYQHSAGLAEKLRQLVSAQSAPDLRLEALEELRVQFQSTQWQAPRPVQISDSPLVRLRLDAAALLLYLDEESRTLGSKLILETLRSKWLGLDTRHAALELLIEESDREAAKPVLAAWLSQPIEDPDLRRAAIRACARRRVIGPLLKLEIEDEEDGVALLEAFVEIDDPSAQERVIRELGHRSRRVRRAAAMTLGRLGDLDAIPALVESLSEDSGRRLRRAVREATASIQEREGVFQSGELSITSVSPLEGSLSRVDGPTGAEVSLVERPKTGKTARNE